MGGDGWFGAEMRMKSEIFACIHPKSFPTFFLWCSFHSAVNVYISKIRRKQTPQKVKRRREKPEEATAEREKLVDEKHKSCVRFHSVSHSWEQYKERVLCHRCANVSSFSFDSILTFHLCSNCQRTFHYYYKSHVESCVDASALVTIVGVCDAAAALSFFVKHISLDGYYELLKEGPVFLYIRIIIRAN